MPVKSEKQNNLAEENKETAPPKKKKKKGFILLILLIVLLAGGGVLYATGFVQGILGQQPAPAVAAEKPVYTFELPEMVFNIADGGRRRFLSIKLSFGFPEPGLEAELEKRMPEIRDAILALMWGITIDEVMEESSIERMKEEIKDAVNDILQTGEIADVYFWHLMIQ